MAKRLIYASKLQKLVKEFRNEAPNATARKYVCDAILSMLGDEAQTPTVDAVEVVRCRDCTHYDDRDCGWGYCYQWKYEAGMSPNDVSGDDFCSYGERKEG